MNRAAIIVVAQVEDGLWRVRLLDGPPDHFLAFGPAMYGGSFEDAERDALRVASKNDLLYLPPELEVQDDDSIIYTPPTPGEGAGARRDRAWLHGTYALGYDERLRIEVVP